MKNLNQDQLEEVNLLFELSKTILITWLSQTKVKQYLKEYTHSEIRCWKYLNWEFVIKNKVYLD